MKWNNKINVFSFYASTYKTQISQSFNQLLVLTAVQIRHKYWYPCLIKESHASHKMLISSSVKIVFYICFIVMSLFSNFEIKSCKLVITNVCINLSLSLWIAEIILIKTENSFFKFFQTLIYLLQSNSRHSTCRCAYRRYCKG